MKLNVLKLLELMNNNFDGDSKIMSKELGISRNHLKTLLSNGSGAGNKFVKAVKDYCLRNGLNYTDYFIIEGELMDLSPPTKGSRLDTQKKLFKDIRKAGLHKRKSYRVWYTLNGIKKLEIVAEACSKVDAKNQVEQKYPGAHVTQPCLI